MTWLRALACLLIVIAFPNRALACEQVLWVGETLLICHDRGEFQAAARAAGITDLGRETFESGRTPVGEYSAGVWDPFYEDPTGARFLTSGHVVITTAVLHDPTGNTVLANSSGPAFPPEMLITLGPLASHNFRPSAHAIGFDVRVEGLGSVKPTDVVVYLDTFYSTDPLPAGFIGIVSTRPFQSVTIHAWPQVALDNIEYEGGPGNGPDNPTPPGPCLPGFRGYCFYSEPGPVWYDPIATTGYEFRTLTGAFTAIDDFPPALGDAFLVSFGATHIGPFAPGQRVDFPGGTTHFRITGIAPPVDGDNPTAFPIKLSLDTVGAMFVMRPLTEADDDHTPPVVNCQGSDGLWHSTNVAVPCSASDEGSGLANATDGAFTLSTNIADGSETADAQTDQRMVCDVAGNCAFAGPVGGNRIDRRAPTITITTPWSGTYQLGDAITASYACADSGSGAALCSGPVSSGAKVDTRSVGAKTFAVEAHDNAGNVSQANVSYTVIAPQRISGSGYNTPEVASYRASFAIDVTCGSIPAGTVQYAYSRTRMNVASSSIASCAMTGNSVSLQGTATVNGAPGYTFAVTATDGSPDTFGIVIRRSDGTVHYSSSTLPLAGGAFTVQP